MIITRTIHRDLKSVRIPSLGQSALTLLNELRKPIDSAFNSQLLNKPVILAFFNPDNNTCINRLGTLYSLQERCGEDLSVILVTNKSMDSDRNKIILEMATEFGLELIYHPLIYAAFCLQTEVAGSLYMDSQGIITGITLNNYLPKELVLPGSGENKAVLHAASTHIAIPGRSLSLSRNSPRNKRFTIINERFLQTAIYTNYSAKDLAEIAGNSAGPLINLDKEVIHLIKELDTTGTRYDYIQTVPYDTESSIKSRQMLLDLKRGLL